MSDRLRRTVQEYEAEIKGWESTIAQTEATLESQRKSLADTRAAKDLLDKQVAKLPPVSAESEQAPRKA